MGQGGGMGVSERRRRRWTVADERKLAYKRIRKGRKGKGYVRVVTNIGHLNIELHCDKTPQTCDNFLQLAERKYYDGLAWHTVIAGYMAQTGDPSGKGGAEVSAWGGYVKDEIRTSLRHDAAGVVSMANAGRDTNRSQWFVTFAAARQLDGTHTVFGKVVGGLFVLQKMESEGETGNPLTVERIEVLVNPIRQAREKLERERREAGAE
ncbi:Peptidyl-prolyl cis-trans isomerase [Chondrus crispus]|uniref:Peptidyl-prolyl cis-trans isomerase n=1 Tax=Chondrus crispus TaxID=2769 RepID=R7QKK6_CHOCR|nr:Peptidyl-prolyl cis-trans isomerase [Chondrus crispus]CDF38313.1 Peptidyl-prolyl cis-trans isomerase [Chondrus crispus]|eukprot:XP_005718198.1 Peptidyl-prolyl cis-trans isomerase [Chondrus crispus]